MSTRARIDTNSRRDQRLDWWRNGLQLNLRIRPAGFVVAVVYAFACWGARQISLDQFYLPAGVRVAALLLCPPRLWPYLILGEYAYFAQIRYPMIDKYGLAWVVIASACMMPAVAVVVRLHRRIMAAPTEAWLLSVAATAALVATVLKLGLSHLLWPVPPSLPILTSAARFALGDYIGILTLAPLALLWTKRGVPYDWLAWRAPPTVIALSSLLVLGVLARLAAGDDMTRTSLQLMLALPVVALTCMHGWRGAAVGVPVLNLLISATTPSTGLPGSFDAPTFATQQVVALAGTALLALGAQISHYFHQYARRDLDGQRAVTLSRTAHIASEMDLRERALGLRRIADGLDVSIQETVELLKRHGHHEPAERLLRASAAHSRQFREQTSMVYPTALEQVGLYLALQVSGAREAWDATDRVSRPRLGGDPCRLSVGLQLATYRTLTDAVSILLKNEYGQIQVRARCGQFRQHRGILVTVGLLDLNRSLSSATMALVTERLTARALAYGGTVRCHRNRIRMLLVEAPTSTAMPPAQAPLVLRANAV
ncbi:MASE1 domain-containing protein [Stenotrophomonas sp. HMWF003]|uniref:MASE1 domain-containing protein n=1 Tax=Stenotrophomonas sp. HMWF003 TaxID=2056840 RepID=UPI000D45AD3C|nr:MASE1 domain-containing protein [Stenotrophomonas sp. HMWF003]PTT64163.1 hypothetical protein DBR34_05140 [Stenotrophomonas sp. HMWF003]